jgi:hypothetical protein
MIPELIQCTYAPSANIGDEDKFRDFFHGFFSRSACLAIGARCSGVPIVLAHCKEDEPLCKALVDTEITY